jgi:DNA-binding NarL/FixJ family response regulator
MAKTAPGEYKKFSKQETKVFILLLQEYKNAEIAKIMGLDEKTICTYKLRLLTKTATKTIIGMYLYNQKHKIVDLEVKIK